jgi:hypothetical protein
VIRWRAGQVVGVVREWTGAIEIDVLLTGVEAGTMLRALAYPDVVGVPVAGDRVILNTTAQALGLGTGGYALVVALPDRLPVDPTGPGHLVKARYSPSQTIVLGVDEQDSPHHDLLQDADSILEMPVVVCDLHSALPAVLAGLLVDRPEARAAYIATDGGALPLAFSRTVAGLTEAGWLCGSVTTGQAYGGDVEAVTVHTGLLAARHVLGADVVVVAQGPGNLGTGTRWGFSGVAAGEAINAAAVLGGRPVASLRISDADPRPRHLGISHHCLTAYGRVAMAAAEVVLPLLAADHMMGLRTQLEPLRQLHRIVEVPIDGLATAVQGSPVPLSSMGRSYDEDPVYFIAAAAAGRHAAALVP